MDGSLSTGVLCTVQGLPHGMWGCEETLIFYEGAVSVISGYYLASARFSSRPGDRPLSALSFIPN